MLYRALFQKAKSMDGQSLSRSNVWFSLHSDADEKVRTETVHILQKQRGDNSTELSMNPVPSEFSSGSIVGGCNHDIKVQKHTPSWWRICTYKVAENLRSIQYTPTLVLSSSMFHQYVMVQHGNDCQAQIKLSTL